MFDTDDSVGPLRGVVVADFSRVLAGPLATMHLGDLGATVVKVERPGTGDDTRSWGPPYVGAMSTYFTAVNRNKLSIELDLDDPADAEVARRLAGRADVLVENFRRGRLAAYGLDAPALHADNPGLVYCSISGFGSAAPQDLPGYDFVVQAVGGLMSITGPAGGPPTKVGVALVDVLTGLHATVAVLAALREREATGTGQLVEVDLLSSLLASLVNQAAAVVNGAPVPGRMGNAHPSIAPYETLEASDGPIAVAVGNDAQFARFAAALGRPELADDPRFATNSARVGHRAELVDAARQAMAGADSAQWVSRLQQAGIACGRVQDVGAAIDLAAQSRLDPVVLFPGDRDDPEEPEPDIATIASPLRLRRTPVTYRRPPPPLGADSARVRAWLDRPATQAADWASDERTPG